MRRFALLVLLLGTAACKQGIGEVCQVDSDCESGLTCTKVAGQTLNHCGRGTGSGTGSDNFDANPKADAEIPDGLPGIPDAGPPDAGPPDAGP